MALTKLPGTRMQLSEDFTVSATGRVGLVQRISAESRGALGNGVKDDTADIQSAINDAVAVGGRLVFHPGKSYLITSALNVTGYCILDFSDRTATLILGTQNQDGIVVGDGTDTARNATFGVQILSPKIVPSNSVAQSSSGAAILLNYVAYVDVIRPQVYGKANGTRKLWTAIKFLRATECDAPYANVQEMHGPMVEMVGTSGTVNRTVDCNLDFARLIGGDSHGLSIGADTAGIGAYKPIIYGHGGWGVLINATTGASGQNYFLTDVDIEVPSGATGGVYVQGGGSAFIRAGWIGGLATQKSVWFGANSSSCYMDVDVNTAPVVIDGTACIIGGGAITGNATDASTGVTIGSAAAGTVIADGVVIRQWPTAGIALSGSPTDVKIGGAKFANNGTDITGISGYGLDTAPVIGAAQTDKTRNLTAAASLTVPVGAGFVQVTGGTSISTITRHGLGATLTIQSGAGGITLASGGNLQLKSAPVSVSAYASITLVCDAENWFEVGRNF